MSSGNQVIRAYHHSLRRIILWLTVAVYTFMLPYVVLVFRAMQRYFPADMVGKIPLLIILIFAVAYAVWGIKIKKTRQVLIILGVSAVIVAIIISVEHNANKHIHIPEYVLMTWILFEAISVDYRGRGIGILILICASMLGIVDEILQGIHPQRSYGWIDMLINTASSFIGVLTLISIRKIPEGDWSWLDNLRKYYKSLIVVFCGAAAAAWMCLILFEIAAAETQHRQFPGWLIIWGLIFVLFGGTTIGYHFCGLYRLDRINQMGFNGAISGQWTAHIWIVYPVSILAAINALCIWIGMVNTAFR